MVHKPRVIASSCDLSVVKSELSQTNGQCTIMIVFCLAQVTQIFVYRTQVIVRIYNVNTLRSKFIETNGQCTI